MEVIVIIVIAGLIFLALRNKKTKSKQFEPFPDPWKRYLQTKVEFYRELSPEEKKQFEKQVQIFISETKVTGIDIDVNEDDKLLVAASAVIPVFAFPEWKNRVQTCQRRAQ